MRTIIYDTPKTKFSVISSVFFLIMFLAAAVPLFEIHPVLNALSLHPEEWNRYLGLNLVSHVFVHRSFEHWGLSLMPLLAFAVLIERRISTARFVALTFIGAVGAAAIQTIGALYFPLGPQAEIFQENYLAGASGLAMAYMGFYGIALVERDPDYLPVLIIVLLPAFAGWFIFVDFSLQVAFLSHIGGLASGMLVGGFTRFQVYRELLAPQAGASGTRGMDETRDTGNAHGAA